MKYLNAEISVIRSDAVRGVDPVDRSTWLMLCAYCADQENGGRIGGAGGWKDRRLQQVLAITHDELHRDCDLWSFDGDDVVVNHYNGEAEHLAKVARENGRKGGRPRSPKTQDQTQAETQDQTQDKPRPKRKERKGKEKKRNTSPPPSPPLRGGDRTTAVGELVSFYSDSSLYPDQDPTDAHVEDLEHYGPHGSSPDPRWPAFLRDGQVDDEGHLERFATFLERIELEHQAAKPAETPPEKSEAAHA